MHRAILQSCLPWFLWLCVAAGFALLLVQYCGGRMDWRKLRRLHSCEDGAVQSLSLVLTLPVFLLLVLFIVQITQIMVGIMMVHYAAFAGARAASVWIPADLTTEPTFYENSFDDGTLPPGILEPANVVVGNNVDQGLLMGGIGLINAANGGNSIKYQKTVLAAVIPCLTISPSRSTGDIRLPAQLQPTYTALAKLYPQVDPASQSNSVMPQRLRNKLRYAANYTTVDLSWQNVARPLPDTEEGPTYNPRSHPAYGIDRDVPAWNPNEVGFRDPVTVVVTHQFALLPGIGHAIWNARDPTDASKAAQSRSHDVSANLVTAHLDTGTPFYTIQLQASATFVNEGYKSQKRYAFQP